MEHSNESGKPAALSDQEETVSSFIPPVCGHLEITEQNFTMSHCSIHDTFKKRLHMFPYKIEIEQKFEGRSYTARPEYKNRRLQNIHAEGSFQNGVSYSDKCVFHVDGIVNRPGVKNLETERPQDPRERARNSEMVGHFVACDVCDSFFWPELISKYYTSVKPEMHVADNPTQFYHLHKSQYEMQFNRTRKLHEIQFGSAVTQLWNCHLCSICIAKQCTSIWKS